MLVVVLACSTMSAFAQTSAPAARIEAALRNIDALERAKQIGYATVWDGNKYVQCRRLPSREMRCEAAGSTMQPSLRSILTGERLSRLQRLGWVVDPAFGGFVRTFPADMAAAAIAEGIAAALVEGYGADLGGLETQTEWVADLPCPPRNGASQNLAGLVSEAPSMRGNRIFSCSFKPDGGAAMVRAAETSEALVARYRPRVAGELQRLRINADKRVYAVFDTGIGYVQCMPEKPAASLYCEAQSAETWPALASVLTSERIARIRAAGFADPGRAPNYSKVYPSVDDAETVAAELLTLLFDAYGYVGTQHLKVSTETGPAQ